LIRLLPGHELPKPAPVDGGPDDWRTIARAIYKQMRGADVGQGYDGALKRIAALEAEITALKAGASPEESAPTPPPAGNVVPLRNPSGSSPPASAAPTPPSPPFVNGTSDLVARYSVPDEPWREHTRIDWVPPSKKTSPRAKTIAGNPDPTIGPGTGSGHNAT
jgi:hypothetical protein